MGPKCHLGGRRPPESSNSSGVALRRLGQERPTIPFFAGKRLKSGDLTEEGRCSGGPLRCERLRQRADRTRIAVLKPTMRAIEQLQRVVDAQGREFLGECLRAQV
jgi:hypothetical protein